MHGPFTENTKHPGTKLWAVTDEAPVWERDGASLKHIATYNKGHEVEASGSMFLHESRGKIVRAVPVVPKGFVEVDIVGGWSSSKFSLQKPPPGKWPDREWPANIGNPPDFVTLNEVIDAFNACNAAPISGPPAADALQCLMDVKANCETRVLATAKVGKWITGWSCSLAQLLFSTQRVAAILSLIAKQGGPACQEELVLLEYILERMGFVFAEDNFGTTPAVYYKKWTKARQEAPDMSVYLTVYRAIENVNVEQLFAPVKKHLAAPNLKRVALISAPADAIDGINEMIKLHVDSATKRTQAKGFRPDEEWTESHEAKDKYFKYFDL